MQQERKELKQIDYVEYKHSYCHFLEPKLKLIRYKCFVEKMPRNYIRKMVLNIIKPSRWTEKERWFVEQLDIQYSSSDIYYLCKNSIEVAHQTFVYVDENGELVD